MYIRELEQNDSKDIFEMLQRIGPHENAFKNEVHGMDYDQYKDWLLEQCAWARGEQLPPGYVRQWTYWLYENNIPIGYGKIREKVTEESRLFGGNIGFAIDPLVRGKGYGKIFFSMLLEEAKKKEIKEIYSTIEKYNYPSRAIHETCGGKMIEENESRWFYKFQLD